MIDEALATAIASVPAGRWGVAVSGGADSVALLMLLRTRADLSLHVVHLNHELRGEESDQEAEFVRDLAARFALPATIARRSNIGIETSAKNASELYRRARLALYRQAIADHGLRGVILGHHQDDQIETVLLRLLRGSGYRGVCGMVEADCVADVTLRRPLLKTPRSHLRTYLREQGQTWCEDSSNAEAAYGRNRLRHVLCDRPALGKAVLELMHACAALRKAVDAASDLWPREIVSRSLQSQPTLLQEQSARAWLIKQGLPAERIDLKTIERALAMIHDAASPSRQALPGGRKLVRRGGRVFVE